MVAGFWSSKREFLGGLHDKGQISVGGVYNLCSVHFRSWYRGLDPVFGHGFGGGLFHVGWCILFDHRGDFNLGRGGTL